MNFADYVKLFFLTFPIFLAIDFTWLGLIAKRFYDNSLIDFERTLRWPVAFLLYVLMVAGVIIISVPKYIVSGNLFHGFLWGGFVGLIMYGTYDLTNLSRFLNWSWKKTLVNILWGMTICGVTGLLASMFSQIL